MASRDGMTTSHAHADELVEEWCRTLGNFLIEPDISCDLQTSSTGFDEHQMDDDTENEEETARLPSTVRLPAPGILEKHLSNLSVLLRDDTNWIPRFRAIKETDIVLLLAPLIVPTVPNPERKGDPFEPLGRTLAQEDNSKSPPVARNKIRHVPYHREEGITSQHLSFISHSDFVILCYVVEPTEQIPLQVADVTFAVIKHRPCVIVICCSPINPDQYIPFPTVIQTNGYSVAALQATGELLLGQNTQIMPRQTISQIPRIPHVWKVDEYSEARDSSEVHRLWNECISLQFSIDQQTLTRLLNRPGYAKHYIVRDTQNGHILGFCATYFHFVDQVGEKLIASVACILVQPENRRRGIGLSLHAHALAQLKTTRGIIRLQLGSTYPRLLFGPPSTMAVDEQWIRRRGWLLVDTPVFDLLLHCRDWPSPADLPIANNVTFRPCVPEEMVEVLDLVDKSAVRIGRTGWYDQYTALMDTPNIKDILIGLEGGTIIAAALTYTPNCGSQIASNLPWAAQIGSDVGGITCVCVQPKASEATVIRLLDACIHKLVAQGMNRVFMDAIKEGVDDLARLGFKEWARYQAIWKDV